VVALRSDRKREHYLQIYVIGIDGKHETALTENQGVNFGPYWYPQGPYIIWAGADHRSPCGRRAAGLLARRQEAHVDEHAGQGRTSRPGHPVLDSSNRA